MARTNALSITTNGTTADQLAESYGHVIESIQKNSISEQLKNVEYSGDPSTGSVEVDRFANATAQDYGTAREGGAGNKLKNSGKVTINLDTDKEIVEEIEGKDVKLFGIPNIVARRKDNHARQVAVNLDRAFFTAAEAAASAVTVTDTDIADVVEAMIQSVETVKNDYVDGVERNMIDVTLSPAAYGKLRNHQDFASAPTNDFAGAEVGIFHGVRVFSNTRQTVAVLAMAHGAVAQPVYLRPYKEEKIPLSDATAVELFYSYGTKALMPDLMKKLATLPTPAEPESGGGSDS